MNTTNATTETVCLNCQNVISENFCGNCGQKKFKRIDKKYLTDEMQYLLLHTNKGFFYSLKNLLKNPGKTARNFIEGNRVNHYKPILMAFVLSTISAFVSLKIIGLNDKMLAIFSQDTNIAKNKFASELMIEVMAFVSAYNSFIMLALIPILSIATTVAFINWGNNYYEHVVMGAFISSLYTVSSLVIIYPLMYIFRDDLPTLQLISMASSLLVIPLLIWFFSGFYREKSVGQVILRVLFFVVICLALFIVIEIIAIVGLLLFKGPEIMEISQEAIPKK
ncbi:DUF3667 domain-containing protein [Flavobacterium sp. NST-5]|uniref:DUF3667 domain-containing protein n=1 Tax=Flavobacterium ichthyis TaxID=2698827 RepID=A0ABW9ZC54_9FLAO|nr:DUF3667 domain-containing protein [Flavobacterium ichthyis]NBL65690.1 DUF3667 domain-containing protein [Flavobacterium ichthyis]